jgi:hypothetical protein
LVRFDIDMIGLKLPLMRSLYFCVAGVSRSAL